MNAVKPASPTSPTASPSVDTLGLGTTQGQRSAELVAALRAELTPTPETRALTGIKGRIGASIVMRLSHSQRPFMNFLVARPATFQILTERNIPKDKSTVKIVEIAAGLSPRGLYLARMLPNTEIIEVDLPGVVAEKQNRFRKANIAIPSNLSWRGADLGVTPLSSVLNNEKVDVVSAEGLNQYFPPEEIQNIARYIEDTLLPGGVYICDISIDEFRLLIEKENKNSTTFFSRQAGKFAGILANEAAAQELLLGAGYARVEYYRPSQVTQSLPAIPKPVIDLSAIFCAYKKAD